MPYLRHDHKLFAVKAELLDGVSENDLGETVRVYLRNQSIQVVVVRTLKDRMQEVCSRPQCRTS